MGVSGNMAKSESTTSIPMSPPVFTQDQFSQILNLPNKNNIGEPSAHMAGILSSLPKSCAIWIVDTGAINHMTNTKQLLLNGIEVGNTSQVQMPTGDSAPITHVGDCSLTGGDMLINVLFVLKNLCYILLILGQDHILELKIKYMNLISRSARSPRSSRLISRSQVFFLLR